jgi:ADP-ribosylglycohydrolase
MLGAIAGDIIGSSYEFAGLKTKDFPLFSQYSRFTDDTVLTIAVADNLLYGFKYHLDRTLDEIRPEYTFELSCQASVPEAIIAFLESTDYEDAIRNAISLGGDSDTIACMAGGIAEAFYGGVPAKISTQVLTILDEPLKIVMREFITKYQLDNLRFN